MAIFTGTNGNDGFPGTANPDIFNMFQGGNDTVTGDLGNDVFNFLNTFNSSDSITGGGGNDTLTLSGDYSAQLLITSAMLSSVERITVAPEHSYNLAIGNGVIDSGAYRLAPPPSPPPNDFAGSSDRATQDLLANQPKPPTPEAKPKDEVVVEGDDGC